MARLYSTKTAATLCSLIFVTACMQNKSQEHLPLPDPTVVPDEIAPPDEEPKVVEPPLPTPAPEIPPTVLRIIDIAPRPPQAPTGNEFMKQTMTLSIMAREDRILEEFLAGNSPDFLWHLIPVHIVRKDYVGIEHSAWVWVTPDYISIGSDQDFMRMPMHPLTAQKIADHFGFLLPTTVIVDAVYQQATIKLKPQPMKPGKPMRGNRYFLRHHSLIEHQIPVWDHSQLVAGHKKDVVITNRLVNHPKRVAIYGWHLQNLAHIQPLSIWHKKSYTDYSHGVRLVYPEMIMDGMTMKTAEVLQDLQLSWVLTNEGPLEDTTISAEGLEWDSDETRRAPP